MPAVDVRRAAPAAEAGLLGDFRRYLGDQRGLGPGTVDAYARYAGDCVRVWWPAGRIAVAELDAGDVISLVRLAMDDGRHGAAIWCGHGVFARNLVKIAALAR